MKSQPGIRPATLIIATAWLSGLCLGFYYHPPPIAMVVIVGLLLLLTIIRVFRHYTLLALIFILAILRVNLLSTPNAISELLRAREPLQNRIHATIISQEFSKANSTIYLAQLDSLAGYPVNGKIRLYAREAYFSPGDCFRALVKIEAPTPPTNPEVFDYRKYLRRKDIAATARLLEYPVITGKAPFSLSLTVARLRVKLTSRVRNRFGKDTGFIIALLLGSKRVLDDAVQSSFINAGLAHLLAISGLHTGIIAMILMLLLGLILPRRIPKSPLVILSLIFYGMLTQWPPSVARAVIMISIFLFAKMLQRKVPPLQVLLVSVLVISAWQPMQLLSPGFQLSVAAVWGILVIVQ
ncbi:MAG: ComEC family competence protein [Candidatus Cloacimonetes bacterium]|nr:ComEC family competence protein [Candidatus Cloacimonadota bacterium]